MMWVVLRFWRVVECWQGLSTAVVKVVVGQAWAVVCGSGEMRDWPAGLVELRLASLEGW